MISAIITIIHVLVQNFLVQILVIWLLPVPMMMCKPTWWPLQSVKNATKLVVTRVVNRLPVARSNALAVQIGVLSTLKPSRHNCRLVMYQLIHLTEVNKLPVQMRTISKLCL
jgi:hypothetical protein